jgi:hypothetical protein
MTVYTTEQRPYRIELPNAFNAAHTFWTVLLWPDTERAWELMGGRVVASVSEDSGGILFGYRRYTEEDLQMFEEEN